MKPNDQKRYRGEPKRKYDFMDEFVVTCPKCEGKGQVKLPHFLIYKKAVFTCSSCFFSEKAIDRTRYSTTTKGRCSSCLEPLSSIVEDRKKIPAYIKVVCAACQTVNKVKENWEAYILPYHKSGVNDPAFGLPLWYQIEVKDELLWAYNDAHLAEIKTYVESELRERTTDRFKMTMVEKLPEFIKLAKNRKEILKAIEKMLDKGKR
jgi:phage FluMu protein Com